MKIAENSIIVARIEHQFPHEDGVKILARAGDWPVAITIAADRIEVSVWAGTRVGGALGWTLRDVPSLEREREETDSGNINAYEFVGVRDYRGEQWMRYHQMSDCPTITSRRDWKYGQSGMEILGRPFEIGRWSEGSGLNNGHYTAYDEDGVREDMRQRLQAYRWLMDLVYGLTDPDSPLCAHADMIAHKVIAETERANYEAGIKARRGTVISDCFQEILRGHKAAKLTARFFAHPISFQGSFTKKQMTAFHAAVYGVAMGEDYSKAGEGGVDIVRDGRRFSRLDVEEYYPHALEFNADGMQDSGVLVNMWNTLAKHKDHVVIADGAEALIGVMDMKTVHDESEAKWFNWHVREDAYAEDAKIRHADYTAAQA